MIIEKVFNKIRYTLSNDNLSIGDKVYPIANGRCLDDGTWVFHKFDFRNFMSGFPNEPHTILDLNHCPDHKSHEVQTDMGYSPKECYYKIIKKEKQEIINTPTKNFVFSETKWVETTE